MASSSSTKATREKRFREREQKRKHFEGPMKSFLQQKYPLIFDEYKAFYDALNRNHPCTRDLTKTCTYKTWASSLTAQDPSDILATALRQVLGQGETPQYVENGESSCQESDQADEDNQPSVADEAAIHEAPLKVTVTDRERQNEAGEVPSVQVDINELADILENVETQVDSIMNELVHDPLLSNILNQPLLENAINPVVNEPVDEGMNEPVDEGIELNPLDHLDDVLIIHPFDYALEVETYEW